MRGLRLHIRWTTPDDGEEVGRFYAAEGAAAPDAEAGVIGKLLGEVVAHGAINRGDALELRWLQVAGALRRKRIGRAMIEGILRLAIDAGFSAVAAPNDCALRSSLIRAGFEERGDVLVKIVKGSAGTR